MATADAQSLRFGDFVLEPHEHRLFRAGQPVLLTPKAFDLLVLLVAHAGHVLSKDELLDTLWRGRLVTESNLTKHIWMLRRALGEPDDGGRYVETVSKLGYRFVAPLITETAIDPPAATAPHPRVDEGDAPVATEPSDSAPGPAPVAIPFDATAPDDPAAPAAPGISADAAANIAAAAAVADHTLAAPSVSDGVAAVGEARPTRSLEYLRTALGGTRARDGPSRSWAVGAAALAVVVVIAGAIVAVREAGSPAAPASPPARAMTAAAPERPAADTAQSATTPPAAGARTPGAEVVGRVDGAIALLRVNDAARARDELLEVVAAAPGYTLAYVCLAQAWSMLGDQKRALAAAEQAAAHAQDAAPSLRLRVDAQRAAARFDWPAQADSLRKLVALEPGDVDVRLQLIDALLATGKVEAAQAQGNALTALGEPARGDARVEIVAARLARAQGDARGTLAHASRALDTARAQQAPALVAAAQMQLGVAQTEREPEAAAGSLTAALAAFDRLGNPHGKAWAHQNLGNLYVYRDPPRARAEYERALAGYQAAGDSGGIAAAYSDLARMLWTAGDRDGADTAVRHVLAIRRETADLEGQAWALTALATMHNDESAADATVAEFREALALDQRVNSRLHHAFTLVALADVLRLRGELAEATTMCAQARAEYLAQHDLAGIGVSALTCAQVALDRGDVKAARTDLADARSTSQRAGDAMTTANADLVAGQIDLGLHAWSQAATKLAAAEREFTSAELVAGQAVASSMQALSYAALGDVAERNRAATRAHTLRTRVTEQQEVFAVDLALAQLLGITSDRAAAIAALQSLAADAQKRHWIAWSLEAQLAELQLREPGATDPRFDAQRDALAATSKRLGFGWVSQRLDAVPAHPAHPS